MNSTNYWKPNRSQHAQLRQQAKDEDGQAGRRASAVAGEAGQSEPSGGSPHSSKGGILNCKPSLTNHDALIVLHRVQTTLLAVDQQLNIIELKEHNKMVDPTITAVIAQIDTATSAIAARIQKLIDAANAAGSVSAAEVVAALQPEVDKLNALGADPSNPVPVV